MSATRSKSTGAITLLSGFLALGLLGQDDPGAKKEKDDQAAPGQRRSARWTERAFRGATQGREFESFLGGELRFKDPQGKPLTVVGVPGKVTKLTTDVIALQLNDGSGTKEFPVKSDGEDGRDLSRQLRRLRVGDRALVLNINGDTKWAERVASPSDQKDEEKKEKDKEEKDEKAKGKSKGKKSEQAQGKDKEE